MSTTTAKQSAIERLRELITPDPGGFIRGEYDPTIQLTFVQISRTPAGRRQYLILVAHNNEVYDITSQVCKAVGYTWNQTAGTLSTTNHAEDIAAQLAFNLFELRYYIPVKVL